MKLRIPLITHMAAVVTAVLLAVPGSSAKAAVGTPRFSHGEWENRVAVSFRRVSRPMSHQPRKEGKALLRKISSWGAVILAGLVLAVGAGSAPVASAADGAASAPAAAVMYSQIVNYNSDLCLGINQGTPNAIQWQCNGHTDQQWGSVRAVTSGYVTIKNLNNQCLGINQGSTAGGARAVAWSCNNHPDQQWKVEQVGSALNLAYLVNLGSGMCLGVYQGSTAGGASVIQWPCNGHNDQKWFAMRLGA